MRRPHLHPGNIAESKQGHSTAGRIMSSKIFNNTIQHTARDLSGCSALPQPTALPRTPVHTGIAILLLERNDKTCVERINYYVYIQVVFLLTFA
jgi:hypothetical protein